MPPKKKVDLPDHVREAVLDDVALSHQEAIDAEERDKIRIFLATEQGLSTYEIATKLGVSQQVVSKWSRQGEEARNRRRGGDPHRSGELIQNGS
ncbi:helix-turn-helix domain-containing protein [Streptomyces scopuliridis]